MIVFLNKFHSELWAYFSAMRMKVILITISAKVFLLLSVSSFSQTINLGDSLKNVLKNKPIPTARIDSRNSFVSGRNARVQGIKAGFTFRKTLTLGLGYSWLVSDIKERIGPGETGGEGQLKMRYMSVFGEYTFYRKGPWEATIPLQIGLGNSFLQVKESGKKKKIDSNPVLLYEPIMTIEYKVLNLIGIGGGVGYRIMLQNNKDINYQFTSPIYVIKMRLIFEEIYKKVNQKRKE
jgi:hypothetical protein